MLRSRMIWRCVAVLTVVSTMIAIGAQTASATVAPNVCRYNTNCGVAPPMEIFVPANYDSAYAVVYGRRNCPTDMYCIAAGEPTILAWRWTGTAWARSSFNRDEVVWVRAYGSGWSWAWTSRTGYLAVQTSRLYTWSYYYEGSLALYLWTHA